MTRAATLLAEALGRAGWPGRLASYAAPLEEVILRAQAPGVVDLSVVVLTWNPGPKARATLESLGRQREALRGQGWDLETILVDNGSEGRAAAPLADLADVAVRLRENTGAYFARNLGSAFARAPVLLFLEDDGEPAEDLAAQHLAAHERFDILLARGVYRPLHDSPLNRHAGHYRLGDEPFPRFCDLEGNASARTSAFREVGGWDDAIFFGHGGVDLSWRLVERFGRPEQLVYLPGPVLGHDYAKSEAHLAAKRERQAESRAYLERKIPNLDAFLETYQRRYRHLPIPLRGQGGEPHDAKEGCAP